MSEGHGAPEGPMGISLSIALIAVLIAVTHLFEGKFHAKAILAQGEETDQWSFYQAKSIKQHTYEMQADLYRLQSEAGGAKTSKAYLEKVESAVAKCEEKVKKYETEKEEIKKKAEEIAERKHLDHHRAEELGYGLLFLEISIMLSSLAALTRRNRLWYLGLALNVGWVWFVAKTLMMIS